MSSANSFNARQSLNVGHRSYTIFSLAEASAAGLGDLSRLPKSIKVLLENQLRHEDGKAVTAADLQATAKWCDSKGGRHEIAYHPARVLMQDFTGVPAVVDLAAMRSAMAKAGGDPKRINPVSPVDLVIDHSVQVDAYGSDVAFKRNVDMEMARNHERYQFLRWGQDAFENFRVVPPGTGICHQVNLEYLAKVVWTSEQSDETVAYPDTLVGTDSHTTMINGLGVLGWGVGGIEAEAAMLGQPVSMLLPQVIGFELKGKLRDGITATDLVLTVTQMLRAHGVVGKFVEFYGEGLEQLPLADRATIANMAPEYGATCGFFPVDNETLNYLRLTGRDNETIELVEAYCKTQGLWREAGETAPEFTDSLSLDMSTVEPSLAGPRRPQDRVSLSEVQGALDAFLQERGHTLKPAAQVAGKSFELEDGAVVIAAITSCTNTSNPSVMLAAGLVAEKALQLGLKCKPWVKTSLAPGSKVVTDYLEKAGLQDALDALGFNLVGYGCTTCIGNSGPLDEAISQCIADNDLAVSAVLSGNRNFEGRIHPQVRASWLASPPLVVAYALAGSTRMDLSKDPIGMDKNNQPVYLKDLWPSNAAVQAAVAKVAGDMFRTQYADVFTGDAEWRDIQINPSMTYDWRDDSTYIQHPPFFQDLSKEQPAVEDIEGARTLALLGDAITTDHISPAGAFKKDSPAGQYLVSRGVKSLDFNSYGSRRGNHEVMMRGTFANIRIRNIMAPGTEGGFTTHIPSGEVMPIFDAAQKYQAEGTPLVVVAGKEYGTGSSRDWAAKGTLLLGVKAVIATSFERIHRSNLVGMGVLPLQFIDTTHEALGLDGTETWSIHGLSAGITPGMTLKATVHHTDGREQNLDLLCRIDTLNEVTYYQNRGILHYVLRQMMAQ